MVGGWVKMRHLRNNFKVQAMVAYLTSDRAFAVWWRDQERAAACDEAVTSRCDESVTKTPSRLVTPVVIEGLLVIWLAARESITAAGILPFSSLESLSQIADVPSLGKAMSHVGWAIELPDGQGVRLPNFSEYNVVCQPSNAKSGAERTRQWRERQRESATTETPSSRDVTETSLRRHAVTSRDDRAEQSRVEKTNTPHTPQEGAGTTSKPILSHEQQQRFDGWWAAYPKKTGKMAALRLWSKLKPDELLLAKMLAALERQKRADQWTRDEGRFIPNPTTWLSQGRWEDEVPDEPTGHNRLGRIDVVAGFEENQVRRFCSSGQPASTGSPTAAKSPS